MERGIEILEGPLAIGRQAEPLMPKVAQARMEAVKSKAWLTAKKVLEPAN
jgi:hypothetical protein